MNITTRPWSSGLLGQQGQSPASAAPQPQAPAPQPQAPAPQPAGGPAPVDQAPTPQVSNPYTKPPEQPVVTVPGYGKNPMWGNANVVNRINAMGGPTYRQMLRDRIAQIRQAQQPQQSGYRRGNGLLRR